MKNEPRFGARATQVAIAVALMAFLQACSASTEADSPGSCTLNCSEPKVPGGEMIVSPYFQDPYGDEIDDDAINVACIGDFGNQQVTSLPSPFRVMFRVYEKVPGFGGRDAEGSTNNGREGDGVNKPHLNLVPRGGIGFEPFVAGGVDAGKTNPEHLNADNTVTPAKFTGVVTPKSEWCSDSCGNMTYEVWGVCLLGKENNIRASIVSGAARIKGSYNIAVKNEEDN